MNIVFGKKQFWTAPVFSAEFSWPDYGNHIGWSIDKPTGSGRGRE